MSVNASNLRFAIRYYYTFHANNGTVVTMLRGASPPKITGGIGGWEIVARRRRKGLTTWAGREPIQMDVPVLFDGGGFTPIDISADVQTLRMMGIGDNFVEPPLVKVEGHLPAAGVVWVIQSIDWGDDVKWEMDETGDDIRTRQDAVVHLLQYSEADTVKVLPTPGVPGYWIVRPGDTLDKIARTTYGAGFAGLWKMIYDANKSQFPHMPRSPKVDLYGVLGEVRLRLPPKPTPEPSGSNK